MRSTPGREASYPGRKDITMKLLKDRQELAAAMNFGRYPVLRIDLADADDYGLKGCRVRIDAGTFRSGDPYIIDAVLRVYNDEKKLTTTCFGACLADSFSYQDYHDMVEKAMAPLIRPDQDVVIAFYHSKAQKAMAAMIVRTGKSVSRGCACPLSFEDVDMSPYLDLATLLA